MKVHIVTGGCGFVGRNMVNRLLQISSNYIIVVDDLSSGTPPDAWLNVSPSFEDKNIKIYQNRVIFIKDDVRSFFKNYSDYLQILEKSIGSKLALRDVFHFAAVVGGRIKIENDPLAVAIDLSIDAEFFHWVSKVRPERVLYPSSSAAYPISLQARDNHKPLEETDIDFNIIKNPDMTYGWAKLTGEYLARITAQKYDIRVTCIRPFSGYGEDQDLSYPIPAITRRIALKQDPLEVWGDGTQCRDFIHIDDVIDGTLKAMDHIHDGSAVNIGSGVKTSFLEVIKLLSEIADYDPKIRLLLDKPVGVHSRYGSIDLARKKLNWSPSVSLKKGLQKVFNSVTNNLTLQNNV
ncbi:MAG: UDP-glucose 4-epimerase [Saprospiraceae bacterium]|jgi:UDP-glucose 4-epimerase